MVLSIRSRKARAKNRSEHEAPHLNAGLSALSVGEMLKRRRVEVGYALPDIARHLNIRAPYLDAIENSRFDELPGSAYATGFLRTYAEALGFDGTAIIDQFRDEIAAAARKSNLSPPRPVPEGRIPSGSILTTAAVLTVVAYGSWYYMSATDRSVVELAQPLPPVVEEVAPKSAEPTQAPSPLPENGEIAVFTTPETAGEEAPVEPSAEVVTTTSSQQAAPVPPTLAAPPQETASTETMVAQPPEAAYEAVTPAPATMEAVPVTAPTTKTYGAEGETPSRIQVRALADSWIEIRDKKGDLVFSRVLRSGDVYRVPDQAGYKLVTGNAGGIVVSVDGSELPPLGPRGKVVRDVGLEADTLKGPTATLGQ